MSDEAPVPAGSADATILSAPAGAGQPTQLGGTLACPVCQTVNSAASAFCSDCGWQLDQEMAAGAAVDLPAPIAELVDVQTSARYPLAIGTNTLGRQGTDILSPDDTVSRLHARITVYEEGVVTVEDCASSNGSRVGDVRLVPGTTVPAASGAVLRFGGWKVILALRPDLDQSTADVSVEAAPSVATESDTFTPWKLVRADGSGLEYMVPDGVATVGRRDDSVLMLPEPTVSGRHAELNASHDALAVRDLRSTNGTIRNGSQRIGEDWVSLLPGDELAFGSAVYRVEQVAVEMGDPDDSGEPDA